jgi:hypothetical protein
MGKDNTRSGVWVARVETDRSMRYTICVKECEKANYRVAIASTDIVAYRTSGVYQTLHLCEYLRELPEYPAIEVEETREDSSLSPS